MRRIGILGGTFNPIHNGHLAIAERAREQFSLEKVLFMPSGVPYMKDLRDVLPVHVRCEMTALAIAGNPYFELSDMEAADAEQGKNTYTYETLQKLKAANPDAEYYFILGADSLQAIEHWKNPEQIFQNCTLLAAVRAEDCPLQNASAKSFPDGSSDAGAETAENSLHDQLAEQIRYLQGKFHASIEILEINGIDLSSTQIRTCIREGKAIHGLVPEAVETYISENGWYRS